MDNKNAVAEYKQALLSAKVSCRDFGILLTEEEITYISNLPKSGSVSAWVSRRIRKLFDDIDLAAEELMSYCTYIKQKQEEYTQICNIVSELCKTDNFTDAVDRIYKTKDVYRHLYVFVKKLFNKYHFDIKRFVTEPHRGKDTKKRKKKGETKV